MYQKVLTTGEVAEFLGAEIVGDETLAIHGVNALDCAGANEITFVNSAQYVDKVKKSSAGAVLINEKQDDLEQVQIVVADVDKALIAVLERFDNRPKPVPGIHPTALVSEKAQIGDNVSIGPFAVIEDDVKIGDNTAIGKGCLIETGSEIGSNTRIDANVIVYYRCKIGNYCIIQGNTTIGGTGFGYRPVNNMPKLIPHLGGVLIEDFVEIGTNCCIDRAKFGNTILKIGSKIDNLVQIAHNCEVGRCTMIAAQVGMAGSSVLGDGVIVAGQVGIADHVNVGSGATLGGQSGIVGNIKANSTVIGMPARDAKKQMKSYGVFGKLPKMSDSLKQLTKRVEELEAAKNNS